MGSAELAVVETRRQTLEPTTFKEALEFADYISKSELVPQDYRGKPSNIVVAIQYGKELGVPPMQALQGIAVINGRPAVWGDLLLAIVMAHPDYEWHKEWIEGSGDTMTAHFQIKRRGQDPHEETFSVDDAKRAGLWDVRARITGRNGGEMANPSPWYCYPKRMLKMRARSFGLRDIFADALKGMKSAEETGDYEDGATIEGAIPTAQVVEEKTNGTASSAVITEDQAREFGKAWKASGYDPKEDMALVKENLKRIAGVESSLKIPVDKYATAMEWARTPNPNRKTNGAKPAAGTPASAVSEDEREARAGLDVLGWDDKTRQRFIEQYGSDWKKVRAEVGILVAKRDQGGD
jgi:hypothetical protein